MSDDEKIQITISLKDARKFMSDSKRAGDSVGRIGDKADKAGRKMRFASGGANMFRSGLGFLAKGAAIAAVAIGVGLVVALKKSYTNFTEAAAITAQVNAGIKSTGGVANVTAKQIDDLSTTIGLKTGIDDEAIKKGQSLLLTFTDIRNETGKNNDIFNQATKAMVNMSAKMGTDASGSAIQLGKALNDPVKGISALSRVGVSFTEGQKKQIKSLTEHGHKLEAQKIILKELGKEFGGAAAAYGRTHPIDRMKVAVGNLSELIGGKLAPYVADAANWVADFALQMQNGTGAGGKFAARMQTLGTNLQNFWKTIKPTVIATAQWIQANLPKMIAAIQKAADWLVHEFGPELKATFGDLKLTIMQWVEWGKQIWAKWGGDSKSGIMGTLIWIKTFFTTSMHAIISVVRFALAILRGDWSGAWTHLKAAAVSFWNAIKALMKINAAVLKGIFIGIGVVLGKIWDKLWAGIKKGASKAFSYLKSHISQIMGWFNPLITGGKIAHKLFSWLPDALKGPLNEVIRMWNKFELKVNIPDDIPGLPNSYTVSTPDISELASGGSIKRRGTGSWISGEAGAEMNTWTPRGIQVTPLQRHAMPEAVQKDLLAAMSGGGVRAPKEVIQIVIDGKVIAEAVRKEDNRRRARR